MKLFPQTFLVRSYLLDEIAGISSREKSHTWSRCKGWELLRYSAFNSTESKNQYKNQIYDEAVKWKLWDGTYEIKSD